LSLGSAGVDLKAERRGRYSELFKSGLAPSDWLPDKFSSDSLFLSVEEVA
jgi:hypothetical protein